MDRWRSSGGNKNRGVQHRTGAPERSSLVKLSPARPRAAWLWSIWRARVDLPQSMVPEKKTSSATVRTLRVAGCDPHEGDGAFLRRHGTVQTPQGQHLGPGATGLELLLSLTWKWAQDSGDALGRALPS